MVAEVLPEIEKGVLLGEAPARFTLLLCLETSLRTLLCGPASRRASQKCSHSAATAQSGAPIFLSPSWTGKSLGIDHFVYHKSAVSLSDLCHRGSRHLFRLFNRRFVSFLVDHLIHVEWPCTMLELRGRIAHPTKEDTPI